MAFNGHIHRPAKVAPTAPKAPEGFKVETFAANLDNPRILAVAGDGTVYVTRSKTGDLLMLRRGAAKPTVLWTRKDLHGIALHGDRMYLATIKEVYAAGAPSHEAGWQLAHDLRAACGIPSASNGI